jgi:RimJ/RimL family protein N-acetyltransferase
MKLPSPTLTGRHVQLEQLRLEHVDDLVAAANEDRATYAWTAVPPTVEEMTAYVTGMLADQERGQVVPFAQRRLADGVLVGCTRYLRLEWWAGRELPAEVEVGGTWLSASAQRTPLNTEAKLLLLRQAFDGWHVDRVAICTDVRNTRSRAAIERIGATFEGVLRRHRGSYVPGEGARDSAMYSVIAEEWPAVEAGLIGRLS